MRASGDCCMPSMPTLPLGILLRVIGRGRIRAEGHERSEECLLVFKPGISDVDDTREKREIID